MHDPVEPAESYSAEMKTSANLKSEERARHYGLDQKRALKKRGVGRRGQEGGTDGIDTTGTSASLRTPGPPCLWEALNLVIGVIDGASSPVYLGGIFADPVPARSTHRSTGSRVLTGKIGQVLRPLVRATAGSAAAELVRGSTPNHSNSIANLLKQGLQRLSLNCVFSHLKASWVVNYWLVRLIRGQAYEVQQTYHPMRSKFETT
ncbi:hypothetical protein BDK51DRAFT_25540 [Blyttiomyces helicus]|uniref:Uncharacterized protein n=1 Tax=Blyttiomyces helicus TaxID=388810 RepID=A0A4P9WDR7_9FUNG|nr:hypothetical protein BDK51DRAFT_25540 [Blyttiomyces helicus]|eukprot:RKO90851.1 hypothetical protein BDK51DRAFT_25540 [Blyttiomyces helicus]